MEQYVFWLVTGACGIGFVGLFFAVKQFVAGITNKFNILFIKIDEILERIRGLIDEDEFDNLEKRVRDVENKMNRCKNCE